MLSNGNGTFSSETTYGLPQSSSPLFVSDTNHDGKPDIIVPSYLPTSFNADINILLKKCKGSLLPFGWWHFLKFNLRKIPTLRLMALGVRKEFHKSGLGTLFYQKVIEEGLKRNYTAAECSWILETNDLMNRPIQQMGGKRYKTYRLYEKMI